MASSSVLHILPPLLIVVVLAVLIKEWLGRPSGPTLDVRAAQLMTNMERRTITYLEAALPWARIHAQVSMGAILAPKKGLSRSQATTVRNRFSSKRVDFVVEDKGTGKVVLLIELDDRYHRPEQDAQRDRMMAAAGYATLRLPASEQPTRESVHRHLRRAFEQQPELLPWQVRYGP
ncbi:MULTISPECIES: DUF2726 domain-containing protein [unclassified Novosphingobium]|uniref:DUF2726 domain-containing protein n=1 Tax=unclassified Novosphingobium TaxID=2644732 RepID=UPI00135B62BD|nr:MULTISPECIES: DUF2726 domain-containing protein [unclassified Novosphingobium]